MKSENFSPRRIGIFGGSFDPVHFGHLILADSCREALQLDEVRLIPAATSPLKPRGPVASDEDRVTMLKLALGGTSGLVVDTLEIDRGGVSYTIDTVAMIAQQEPAAELFLMIGADSVASLDRWHRPADLLRSVRLAVVSRGGHQPLDLDHPRSLLNDAERAEFQPLVIEMPEIELSSSELRDRVAQGRSIRFRTPRAVEAFIAAQGLYREHQPTTNVLQ